MGTTGHYVSYYQMSTTEKVREWLRNEYTWEKYEVIDLAQGTKRKSGWWLAMKERDTGKVRAMQVITNNRAKREGMFYTKEVSEDMGPYATDIPKRLFSMLTPLESGESEFAEEWRTLVQLGVVKA